MFTCIGEFGACSRSGDDIVGFATHASADIAARDRISSCASKRVIFSSEPVRTNVLPAKASSLPKARRPAGECQALQAFARLPSPARLKTS